MPGTAVVSVSNDISVDISRPENATAYTALDVIGVADSVTPANAGSAILTFNGVPQRAMIQTSELLVYLNAVPGGMGAFRLHLYSASPAAILDNAAFNLVAADRNSYQGFIDMTTPVDYGDTLFTQAAVSKRVYAPSGVLYGVLQTVGAFTPTSSEDYKLTLRVVEA